MTKEQAESQIKQIIKENNLDDNFVTIRESLFMQKLKKGFLLGKIQIGGFFVIAKDKEITIRRIIKTLNDIKELANNNILVLIKSKEA